MKGDGVHNYFWGGWPEMPWKREKDKADHKPVEEVAAETADETEPDGTKPQAQPAL